MLRLTTVEKFPTAPSSKYEHEFDIILDFLNTLIILFQDCCNLDDIPDKKITEKIAKDFASQKMSDSLMECVSSIT